MNISTREFTQAKEATSHLLEQLGLETYVFEVEPREGPWEVHIDCALGDGWQTLTLPVDIDRLLGASSDETVRRQILKDWNERLAACLREPTAELGKV